MGHACSHHLHDRAAQLPAAVSHLTPSRICLAPWLRTAACYETALLPRTPARAQRAGHGLRDSLAHCSRLRARSHAKPRSACPSRTQASNCLFKKLAECLLKPILWWRVGMAGGPSRSMASHPVGHYDTRARSSSRAPPWRRSVAVAAASGAASHAAAWASVLLRPIS